MVTMHLSGTVIVIFSLKDIGGHHLDHLGSCDVIGHVTVPLPCGVSYRWSVVTIRLSGTVIEIFSFEDNGVTTLTFCGHVTSSVT